ncbi:hypothetical protein WJX72_004422 [[Myrmecia] bisecta]|uniref:Uncharacterized protein n=1 Tax=[Myrmecia] bisecta TaxID=41462 RepID=A0AAW1QQC8_9CHLO
MHAALELYDLTTSAEPDTVIAAAAEAACGSGEVSAAMITRLRTLSQTRGALLDIFIDVNGGGDAFTSQDVLLDGNTMLGLRLAAHGIFGCDVEKLRSLLNELPGNYERLFTCQTVLNQAADASAQRQVADAELTGIVYPKRAGPAIFSSALHLTMPVYFLLAIRKRLKDFHPEVLDRLLPGLGHLLPSDLITPVEGRAFEKLTAFQLVYRLRALALCGKCSVALQELFCGAGPGASSVVLRARADLLCGHTGSRHPDEW